MKITKQAAVVIPILILALSNLAATAAEVDWTKVETKNI